MKIRLMKARLLLAAEAIDTGLSVRWVMERIMGFNKSWIDSIAESK